jgi:hypothetical protein
MNRYHIDSQGRTVDQYGRTFNFETPTPRQRRQVSRWRKSKTTFVKLQILTKGGIQREE